MSEKKSKEDRKMKIMTEEAGIDQTAKEMAKSIAKMYEDRDKKALGAKEHLVSQLNVTSDKYRTANGVMNALQIVREVIGDGCNDYVEEISIAKTAATRMAGVAQEMAHNAEALDPDEMSKLCQDFYDPAFSEGKSSAIEMVDELLRLQLCQNVGPNAEDVEEFCKTADQEIEKARDDLKEFCEKNDLDFNELCGPHDNCPDCLCMDCAMDCKQGKTIEEGQSAYEVCDGFVAVEE